MDYSKKTVPELKALCKERNIKGISGKNKSDLITMLEPPKNVVVHTTEAVPAAPSTPTTNIYNVGDNVLLLKGVSNESIDMIYLDPPYNTGRNFYYFQD